MNNPLHFQERDQLLSSSDEESRVSPSMRQQSDTEDLKRIYDKHRTKIVRFKRDDEAETRHPILSWSDISSEQKCDMWWQDHEYMTMKNTAKAVASAIRNGSIYHPGRYDYVNIIHDVYVSRINNINPGRIKMEMFKMWVAAGHSRRGLESWSIPGLFEERQKRKRNMYQIVLQTYKDQEMMGTPLERKGELVRAVYERVSSPSKLLALDFGAADELAAKRETVVRNAPTIELELSSVLPAELLQDVLPNLVRARSYQSLLQRSPPDFEDGTR